MDIIEIYFEKIKGSATLIDSSGLHALWRIEVGEKYLIIEDSYTKAQAHTLKEYRDDVDLKKAIEQVPIIMWQIEESIKSRRPRPPKRYR